MEGETERKQRFESKRDEILYRLTIDGWGICHSGDIESPMGWFAVIDNEPHEMDEVIEAFEEVLDGADYHDTDELVGSFLVREHPNIVYAQRYDSLASVQRQFNELEKDYQRWQAGQE